jgi:hypothetical protein
MEEGNLFDHEPSFLPILEEDETLYSWGARYHRRSGNARASDSSRILFGAPTAWRHHDFPSHIGHLIGRIGQELDAEKLVFEHTIFGATAKFLDPESTGMAKALMLGTSVTGLKQKLGLLKSGVGATFPLKACRECMVEDLESPIGSRWHLEHQWPTSWSCSRHGQPLIQISPIFASSERCGWLLPDTVAKENWIEFSTLSDTQLDHLVRFTALTAGIVSLPMQNLGSSLLRMTYLLGASRKGFVVTSDGSVRFRQLVDAVKAKFLELEDLPMWGFIQQTKAMHGGFVGLLMRQYRGNHHIAKHIPLIDFLFGSFEKFHETYVQVLSATTTEQIDELSAELHETRDQVLHMVRDENISVTSAASRVGVRASQALLWVKKAGISYNARPRVLCQEREEQLISMLKAGQSWNEIVEQLGIKKSWLRAFLAANVQIRRDWSAKHAIVMRNEYREHLLALLRDHPGVPLKRIKSIPGNGFSWLYRNDPQWLASNLPLMSDAN